MDLMPTCLDMANHRHPNSEPKSPTDRVPYRGHMVYPMRGKSWLPYFERGILSGNNETEAVHAISDEPVGWESECFPTNASVDDCSARAGLIAAWKVEDCQYA